MHTRGEYNNDDKKLQKILNRGGDKEKRKNNIIQMGNDDALHSHTQQPVANFTTSTAAILYYIRIGMCRYIPRGTCLL